MSISRPIFHSTLMGYNKIEINDYINKLEAEINTCENKRGDMDQKLGMMELEAIQRTNQLAAKDDEIAAAARRNQELEEQIKELRVQLIEKDAAISKMQREYLELKKTYDESEYNPKLIQDAILNAQNLGKTIVDKANEDADGIRVQAMADKASKDEEGRLVMLAAKQQADMTIADAKQKCVKLQSDYNQMLMDASAFKAELMGLYRRHMELLTAFPEKEVIAVDVKVEDVK